MSKENTSATIVKDIYQNNSVIVVKLHHQKWVSFGSMAAYEEDKKDMYFDLQSPEAFQLLKIPIDNIVSLEVHNDSDIFQQIENSSSNIPLQNFQETTTWFGDMAKFIMKNFVLEMVSNNK